MSEYSIKIYFRYFYILSATVFICLSMLSGCNLPHRNANSTPGIPASPGASPAFPVSTSSFSPTVIQSSSPTAPAQKTTPQASPTNPIIPDPTGTLQVTLAQPSPTPSTQVTVPAQYTLDAVFDYWQQSLTVVETIHYVNPSHDSLTDLFLIVEPNLIPGGLYLNSLSWVDGKPVNNYDINENQLRIPLPQPLAPAEAIGVILDYDLYIPQIGTSPNFGGPVAYGYSTRQTNLVDWYAYVPPYREGVGWLVHPTWWFGEYQVYDVAIYDVTIRLAVPVKDLVLAASAPDSQEGDTFVYHLEAARTFAISASTEYSVQTTTVGGITVISYSFPYDKYSGQEVLKNTADAVQLYSQLFLPYPRLTLSAVEADFMDGMEYDGLFFLSRGFYDLYDGTPKGYLTFIAAHETAHQWWFSLVGNDQAQEPWLDEALCTYMERVFYENLYSDYPPRSGGSLVDWWWYYRVNFYDPTGWVGGTVYDYPDSLSYRDAVYLNGAKFLEDLRNLIGDQAFFASLKEYATMYSGRIATAQDFFAIIRGNTDQNLDDLMSRYFLAGQ